MDSTSKTNRPSSTYDNIQENYSTSNKHRDRSRNADEDTEASRVLIDGRNDFELNRTAITFITNTTVPQNIMSNTKITGRHTPTRNSLRHSRMIVMNKTGNQMFHAKPVPETFNKIFIVFEILKTSIGLIITAIAVWLLVWTPSLHTTEKPYWCGIPLLISGLYGLYSFTPSSCFKVRKRWCCSHSITKIIATTSTLIAGILCCAAFILIVIHFLVLSNIVCSPMLDRNSTCICHESSESLPSEESSQSNVTYYNTNNFTVFYDINLYHFVNLTCPDVRHILLTLFIILGITTGIGIILSFVYVYVFNFKSRLFRKY